MKILVTGHKGFVGSYLMTSLELRQGEIIGLDIKNGPQEDILTCPLPKADVVIHLAAEPGVIRSMEDPITSAVRNIIGTLRLIDHYKDAKFIFASSGGTIQESIESPYGLTKYVGEEYIKMLHNNYVILRFCNVYGKGSRSVVDKWLNEDELTIFGDGKTMRIYGHVSDVVNAILKSLDWSKGTYKLGTDQRYSVLDIAKAIGKPFKHAPARKGEITHSNSELANTTPKFSLNGKHVWEAKTDVMEYIRENS